MLVRLTVPLVEGFSRHSPKSSTVYPPFTIHYPSPKGPVSINLSTVVSFSHNRSLRTSYSPTSYSLGPSALPVPLRLSLPLPLLFPYFSRYLLRYRTQHSKSMKRAIMPQCLKLVAISWSLPLLLPSIHSSVSTSSGPSPPRKLVANSSLARI